MRNKDGTFSEEEIKKMLDEEGKPMSEKDWNDLKDDYVPSEGEVFCPFCGVSSGYVKTNGDGFYRCKGKCRNNFLLMKYDEKKKASLKKEFCESCCHNKEAHTFGNCAYCNCKGFIEKKKVSL
jgi:hypothetical protein